MSFEIARRIWIGLLAAVLLLATVPAHADSPVVTTQITMASGWQVNYAAKAQAISAGSTSPAPIVFSSSDTSRAQVDPNTGALTLLGAGDVTITASQAAGDYTVSTVTSHYTAASASGILSIRNTVPPSERAVLASLYTATNGPGWINPNGWTADSSVVSDVCSWQGITCSGDGWGQYRHVATLDLSGQHLIGTLPDLSALTSLTVLSLGNNTLSGSFPSLPPTITRLTLSYNQFSGPLPALPTGLTQFVVNGNQFTGTLPAKPVGIGANAAYLCSNGLWAGDVGFDAAWSNSNSPSSNWLGCQWRLTPVITLSGPPSLPYGTVGQSVTATSSSPAPIVYSSSAPSTAAVNPSTGVLTLAGYGSATLTVSQAAFQNYASGSKSLSLTVVAQCDRTQHNDPANPGRCLPNDGLGGKVAGTGACGATTALDAATGLFAEQLTTCANATSTALDVPLTFNANQRDVRNAFDRQLVLQNQTTTPVVTAMRPDGQALTFTSSSSGWTVDADITLSLANSSGGYTLRDSMTGTVENYDTSGTLTTITPRAGPVQHVTWSGSTQTVTDDFGRSVVLSYTTAPSGNRYVAQITDAAGRNTTFAYDFSNTAMPLTRITFADGSQRNYTASANGSGYQITITDETGATLRSLTTNSAGQVTAVSQGSGQNNTSLTYNLNGSTTTIDALGTQRVTNTTTIKGVKKELSVQQPNANGSGTVTAYRSYDANGNQTSWTDFRGVATATSFDTTRNLPLSRTEASGTSLARTTTYTWHPSFVLPTQIVEPGGRTTTNTYDGSGNLLSKIVTAGTLSQAWTWTYNSFGQVLTARGPRTDVNDTATMTYSSVNGNLLSVTNALGQVTIYANHDAYGRPRLITAPDGVATQLVYDYRGRLAAQQTGTELTQYFYNGSGQLIATVAPDGSTVNFGYDTAQRLTSVSDGLGNTITYTLDAQGNRTGETRTDGQNNAVYSHSRIFNALGRIAQDIGAVGQTTVFTYDNAGNVLTITDPLTHITTNTVDLLNRVTQVKDPANELTKFTFDVHDNVTAVIDPKNQTTSYTVNGLDQVTAEVSPNRGTTNYIYDTAGNVIPRTDARGVTSTTTYDVLNRPLVTTYPDETVTYSYDFCSAPYGTGKLCGVVDGSGTTSFTYGSNGRIASKTQSIANGPVLTTQYGWNAAGQLVTVVTPAGNTIGYSYANGRPVAVTVNGTTLLSGVQYEPFGPNGGWTWGNGDARWRIFDADGRLIQWQGPVTKNITWDAANRITAIAEPGNASALQSYGYDVLDRLTSASIPGSTFSWGYDGVGNRTSQTASGATTNYTYASTSQRLASTSAAQIASFGYDAMGNTTSVTGYGAANFTFDGKGRMSSAAAGGVQTNYKVNASGQRVLKIGPTSSTVYAYDERGRLIGEYDANGTLKQETAWLDDLPAATLRPTGVYYVHADHLGTPRFVTEPASRVVRWQWTGDPFGVAAPNENPASAGAFSYNLRFPGQMFDAETILNYNWHRDYNPNVGRYTQSDPIGLRGGLNTYAYVTANPIVGLDMSGLANGSAAQMWMKGRPNCLRGPDFVNFQIDMYVGSVSGTFSRDGNSFLGFGVNRGYANPVSLSASVSIGWLNSSALSPGQTNSFLRGFSGGGATMYSGVGGGIAISPGNGTATVIGIGAGMSVGGTSVGSAGLGLGYGVEQGRTGLSWGSGSCTCN